MDTNQNDKKIEENSDLPFSGTNLSAELERHRQSRPGSGILVAAILISVVFGAVGGAFGAAYLPQVPALSRLFTAKQVQPGTQKLVLAEDSAIIDVVKKASPAVVSVIISKDLNKIPGYSTDPFNGDPFSQFFGFGVPQQQPSQSGPNVQQVGAGSGFFVSEDGQILTNAHVVSDQQASYTVLTSDGKHYDAKVLARDTVNDIAILKIDIQNAPILSLGDSSNLQIGQRVVAIGNSLGEYQNTVTSGIVSGIGRSVTAGGEDGSEQLEGAIQTDAAINPGNSGGPLLNIDGQVIGINTAIDRQGQLVGFALPINDGKKALESYRSQGRIVHAFLGVRYVLINSELAKAQNLPKDFGALVTRGQAATDLAVIPGSPADKAGIQENDIILEVNHVKVDESNSLVKLLKDFNVGDTVDLQVYHKGQEKLVQVKLEENKQ